MNIIHKHNFFLTISLYLCVSSYYYYYLLQLLSLLLLLPKHSLIEIRFGTYRERVIYRERPYYFLVGNMSSCRGERKMILMDPVLADISLAQQQKALSIRRKEAMSRKERRDAIASLLEMIRKHEAEWTEEKIIAEFSFRHGYTKKTTKGYLEELLVMGRVCRGDNSVYLVEPKHTTREAPKK